MVYIRGYCRPHRPLPDGGQDDDREPNACDYFGCTTFKPDEMVERRPYGEETTYWYCPKHDPLEGEYPENWTEA